MNRNFNNNLMKKILVSMAAVLMVLSANAQSKSVSAATSALASAKEATLNPKKNTKAATWIKYATALMDAYNAPAGNGMLGQSAQEVNLLNEGEKPISEEQVVLAGNPYVKQVFRTRNHYFNANGQLAIVEVTKPIVENALDEAVQAYAKAASLDASKAKDVVAGLEKINQKFNEEAVKDYNLGNLEGSSVNFEKAAEALATAPCNKVDTSAVYNAGLTAFMVGNTQRAKTFFEKCVTLDYYGTDGDVFAKLADIADKSGDKVTSKLILEDGFVKYPQSQAILVGLINYYVSSGEDTNRLFELLDGAKKNEPNNASLYYVEGDIRGKLGQEAEALAAYSKCAEINPSYEFGYIGMGTYFYNKAVSLSEAAANELDDKKYSVLMEEMDKALKSAVEPFEKAFEITKDDSIKVAVAEYLKNACFRLRNGDETYMAKYEKYSQVK